MAPAFGVAARGGEADVAGEIGFGKESRDEVWDVVRRPDAGTGVDDEEEAAQEAKVCFWSLFSKVDNTDYPLTHLAWLGKFGQYLVTREWKFQVLQVVIEC